MSEEKRLPFAGYYLKAVHLTGQNDKPTLKLSLTRPYLLFISPSLLIYVF